MGERIEKNEFLSGGTYGTTLLGTVGEKERKTVSKQLQLRKKEIFFRLGAWGERNKKLPPKPGENYARGKVLLFTHNKNWPRQMRGGG